VKQKKPEVGDWIQSSGRRGLRRKIGTVQRLLLQGASDVRHRKEWEGDECGFSEGNNKHCNNNSSRNLSERREEKRDNKQEVRRWREDKMSESWKLAIIVANRSSMRLLNQSPHQKG
jgi:hypothetical protein